MSKNKWNEYDILGSPLYIKGFFVVFSVQNFAKYLFFYHTINE